MHCSFCCFLFGFSTLLPSGYPICHSAILLSLRTFLVSYFLYFFLPRKATMIAMAAAAAMAIHTQGLMPFEAGLVPVPVVLLAAVLLLAAVSFVMLLLFTPANGTSGSSRSMYSRGSELADEADCSAFCVDVAVVPAGVGVAVACAGVGVAVACAGVGVAALFPASAELDAAPLVPLAAPLPPLAAFAFPPASVPVLPAVPAPPVVPVVSVVLVPAVPGVPILPAPSGAAWIGVGVGVGVGVAVAAGAPVFPVPAGADDPPPPPDAGACVGVGVGVAVGTGVGVTIRE